MKHLMIVNNRMLKNSWKESVFMRELPAFPVTFAASDNSLEELLTQCSFLIKERYRLVQSM